MVDRGLLISDYLENIGALLKPFSTNISFMDKPGSWFLLAKCLKNTTGRVTF